MVQMILVAYVLLRNVEGTALTTRGCRRSCLFLTDVTTKLHVTTLVQSILIVRVT